MLAGVFEKHSRVLSNFMPAYLEISLTSVHTESSATPVFDHIVHDLGTSRVLSNFMPAYLEISLTSVHTESSATPVFDHIMHDLGTMEAQHRRALSANLGMFPHES